MGASIPHITVCVVTYKRLRLLRKLLDALTRQETAAAFTYSAVVTDNDGEMSAADVVRDFGNTAALHISYCVEPRQNIALARNKALEAARGDYVAFIDDDEFPTPQWLLLLFQTLAANQVDGVLGPVKPHFEESPPKWIVKGNFHDRPSYPTGTIIDWKKGRTGNVLLKRSLFDGLLQPFNPEFITGEDQDFFRRMIESGHVFMWCHEALAYETVPSARFKRSFLLRKALLRGRVSLLEQPSRGQALCKSSLALIGYGAALPLLMFLGQHAFMTYLVKSCDHLGRILAWCAPNGDKPSTYISD